MLELADYDDKKRERSNCVTKCLNEKWSLLFLFNLCRPVGGSAGSSVNGSLDTRLRCCCCLLLLCAAMASIEKGGAQCPPSILIGSPACLFASCVPVNLCTVYTGASMKI